MFLLINTGLALDIWTIIVHSLDRRSLLSLCLASKFFLNIARPVLYRSVYFCVGGNSGKDHLLCTLDFLCSNPKLSERVINMAITTTLPATYNRARTSEKVDESILSSRRCRSLEVLSKMSSLKYLFMEGMIFSNANEMRHLAQLQSSGDISLKAFHFNGTFTNIPFPSSEFPLAGLTSVTWDVRPDSVYCKNYFS